MSNVVSILLIIYITSPIITIADKNNPTPNNNDTIHPKIVNAIFHTLLLKLKFILNSIFNLLSNSLLVFNILESILS